MTVAFHCMDEFYIHFITPRKITLREWSDMGYDGYDNDIYDWVEYPYESGKTVFVGAKFDEDMFIDTVRVADTAEELADCDAVVEYTLA